MEKTLQKVQWKDYYKVYPRSAGHSVSGNLKVAQEVESPSLNNRRDIIVYLPPSYKHSDNRYPVLYMQDGQNLFDPATSFAGEWQVDETLEDLCRKRGTRSNSCRHPKHDGGAWIEYSPFVDHTYGGGQGNHYVAFIANTLKPLIDAHFRTLPQRRKTGIMGSSMGGLISLYAFFRREDVFGFAGVMSPSLWFARGSIYSYVENASYLPGRIYLDAGTREMGGTRGNLRRRVQSRNYYASVRRLETHAGQ